MSESARPGSAADYRRRPDQGNGTAPSGVSIGANGNVSINGSDVAGRDINRTTVNNRRNVRVGIGLGSVALVAVVGLAIHAATGGSNSVVYQTGAQGAAGTLQHLQQAEENGNASDWCFLASSNDSSTCQNLLENGYSSPESAGIRGQVSDISIGPPAGGGEGYTFNLTYDGHSYPGVPLEWTGQRWQLSPEVYYAALNDGGIFSAVVETAKGQGALLGVPFG
jgi:hypothetical protein